MPPDGVLATRIGHLAGSSPMLPIVMWYVMQWWGFGMGERSTRRERETRERTFLNAGRRGAIGGG